MSLPTNRIGAARGPNGTTLDDLAGALALIATKLDALIASTPPATNLGPLLDAIGSRADCTTGESIVGLLCRLNDSIAGVVTVGGPPATCPLFPSEPTAWLYTTGWTENAIDPPPVSGAWKATIAAQGVTASLYIENVVPYTEYPDYVLSVIKTDTNGTNVCISYEHADSGYSVKANFYDADTHTISVSSTLWSPESETGIGSEAYTLDTGEYLLLVASSVGGPIPVPACTLWVVQGPFG